jgi:hypothetical protein
MKGELLYPILCAHTSYYVYMILNTATYYGEVYILTERLKNFCDRSSCYLHYTRFVRFGVCTYFNTRCWNKALKCSLMIKHPNGDALRSPLVHPIEVVRVLLNTPPHFLAVRVGGDGGGGGLPLSTRNRDGSQS